MGFDTAITRLPLPYDTDRGREVADAAGWADGDLRKLLVGAAGCSPYLAGLIPRHADWLEGALRNDAAASVDGVIAEAAQAAPDQAGQALRRAKQKIALLTALADLGGVWGLDQVTGTLTRFADTAVQVALVSALSGDVTRGKVPGATEADLETACGLVAMAMGKMGAGELNYSSDIDLIVLFDDARWDDDALAVARPVLVRAVRQAMTLLSQLTDHGYVFRTDLRLRPDPSVTPVAVSMSAAERYYEGMGRTWERAAYVKARPAAGDIAAGARFLRDIRPFIWRRHLDFATIEDTEDIRKKIRAQAGQGGDTLDGRNLKLGPGGIREIEFFTQTRQLIAGGRDPDLRDRGTRPALAKLSAKGWVDADEAAALDADYTRLRELEHRVQMVQDAQTHALPRSAEDWQRLAMFTGQADADALKTEIGRMVARVQRLTEDFFATPKPAKATRPVLSAEAEAMVDRWRTYPALRSTRAREIFDRVLPRLLTGFEGAARPDEALVQFDRFLHGLPAGVQVLSLFESNPQLIDLMVDISSTAPALARYLGDNPGVLDSVIGGAFFEGWPGYDALLADLRRVLANPDLDYERQLDAARHWQKDWHFRIGVHHLRGLISADDAATEYSDLAQACVAAIWDVVQAEFARKHGVVPGRGAVVLGMGSIGAHRLTAASDLDLIVIYDAGEAAESDGRKPLGARTYFARLTKAMITALSAQTAAGALYEVDMRLRPSGRQGPAATSWDSFQTYHRTEAWTWEHLAQTRARVLAGNADLAADVEAFRRDLLAGDRDIGAVCAALADMRRRLADAKPRSTLWDVNNGPGGLQDIELFAQAIALTEGATARQVPDQLALETPLADDAARAMLGKAHRLQAAVKATARLLTDTVLDADALGHGGHAMLMRETGAARLEALDDALSDVVAEAAQVIDVALAEWSGGNGPADGGAAD